MTRRRAWLRTLALSLGGLALAGCWSRLETNELAVVIAYGMDWRAGTYTVVASVFSPRELGTPGQGQPNPQQPAHVLMTASSTTPGKALADLDNVSSRRVLWDSAQVMVVGQGLAEHGIDALLSAVTHSPNFRPTTLMLISHGPAEAIFTANQAGLESTIGRDLYLMALNQERAESESWAPHVFDVVRWESDANRAMLVPGLSASPPGLPQGQPYRIADSAVLEGGRLVAWLPDAEVRPVLWMEGLFVHGSFNVPCPGGTGQQGMVTLTRGTRTLRTLVRAGRISGFAVRLTGMGQVSQGCAGASPAAMSGAADASVSAVARDSLRWSQGADLDLVGFGEAAYRWHPRIWLASDAKDWPGALAAIPVDLSVRIRITQAGMTR